MPISRLFFIQKNTFDKVYFLDLNLKKTNNVFQTLIQIEKCMEKTFALQSITHIELSTIIDNKILIGPIQTFESVFSTTTCNLLNNNDELTQLSKILRFEKLSVIKKDELFDTMLLEEYTLNYLHDTECLSNTKLPNIHNEEFDLNDPLSVVKLKKYGICFDENELIYYRELFNREERNPNLVELFDLCQSNSEHSRHWFFNGKYIVDEIKQVESLFKMVKSTLNSLSNKNSLVSFSDNSSVIRGDKTQILKFLDTNEAELFFEDTNLVLTAETHNFPTLICPFEGASTGVGGRIRDNHSTGRGSYIQQSLAGYCVGDIYRETSLFNTPYVTPLKMLVEASNGASDYGNKIGEPIVGGFTRGIGNIELNNKFYEFLKPIMFSAGIGTISHDNVFKRLPEKGDLVIRLGGPVYKIGLGGGFNSSIDNKSEITKESRDAVQRGDPQMENKLNRVITKLSSLNKYNPIISIHDQGAGGLANVLKEIVYPNGAKLNLDNVTLGDKSLNALEIWCSEFQESSVILINPEILNIDLVRKICYQENVIMDIVGEVFGKDDPDFGKALVYFKNEKIVDFMLEPILNPDIRKLYNLDEIGEDTLNVKNEIHEQPSTLNNIEFKNNELSEIIKLVLSDLDVCSKRFLTTKVDRSVTGLVYQQQCVGPFEIPCSDYSAHLLSYTDVKGTCSSIGEKPILGFFSEKLQAQYSFAEMLTNLSGAYIGDISTIKCSVNWMWANKSSGESKKLYKVAKELTKCMKIANVGIDGGKDSLSMSVKVDSTNNYHEVVSPGNVVVTSYAFSPNLKRCVTSDFKDMVSILVFIPFTDYKFYHNSKLPTFKGSVLWKILNNFQNKNKNPIIDFLKKPNTQILPSHINFNYVKSAFNLIQELLKEFDIISLHDVSDGGLITTLFEMAYSGFKGANIYGTFENNIQMLNFLFSEEPGVVIEVGNMKWVDIVRPKLSEQEIPFKVIGWTKKDLSLSLQFNVNKKEKIFEYPLGELSEAYESLPTKIENIQCKKEQVLLEAEYLKKLYSKVDNKNRYISNPVDWFIPTKVVDKLRELSINTFNSNTDYIKSNEPLILILRDEGSNGDKEMCAFFKLANFDVINYNLKMLEENIDILKSIDGIAFVGGFTFSDIMGSATCWATRIKNNKRLFTQLSLFFNNTRKFVIGVCNGFQLLIKLKLFGDDVDLVQNDSQRFESRFSCLKVNTKDLPDSDNIFFKNMENTTFGMWIAHGEGKFVYKKNIEDSDFIPVLYYSTNYCDTSYPQNPNGSKNNIAGVISKNKRILGLMPHFERSFLTNQCQYIPSEFSQLNIKYSPWFYITENIKLFLNTIS